MSKFPATLAALAALLIAGCGVGEGTGSTPPWVDPETPTAPPALATDEVPIETIDPYRVRLETTQGDVVIAVHPEWAPRGAQRFRELVEAGYYDDNRIFRVMPGFVVQFGMHGDPETNRQWSERRIPDDPVEQSNRRGYVTFATSGPDSRTTQVFINLSNNTDLDDLPQNFAPFGEVVEGMDVVASFNSQYGTAPSDQQPRIAAAGNEFLDAEFPGLDSIVKATIIEADAAAAASDAAAPKGDPPAEAVPTGGDESAPADAQAP
jgi:peptidyl-prolyl cis-trans isomerase A (cyclophilin A)